MLQRMLQLNPLLPVDTPIGPAMAHAIIDYGEEHYLYFVCFIDVGGECHIFKNTDVTLQKNETLRPAKPVMRDGTYAYNPIGSERNATEIPRVPGELHGRRDY